MKPKKRKRDRLDRVPVGGTIYMDIRGPYVFNAVWVPPGAYYSYGNWRRTAKRRSKGFGVRRAGWRKYRFFVAEERGNP
jgi:hypothetical protein